MKSSKNKPTTRRAQNRLRKARPETLPFIAHLQELRRRLFLVALTVAVFTGLATTVQARLTTWLLKPSGGQHFIYTTPGGGLDFQLRLCLYAGIALSIPMIIFQVFRYVHPLLGYGLERFLRRAMVASSLLAFAGILFGYFFGLPPSLHFLLQNFSSDRIAALITIQSYMSFVTLYLLGCAIAFQLPLILLLINRIRPLKPRTLMRGQRWVLLGAVVAGAIISPTPDIRNLLMISGPIILLYELSIVMIWLINGRHGRSKKITALLAKDAELQAARLANFQRARTMRHQGAPQSAEQAIQQSSAAAAAKMPTQAHSQPPLAKSASRPRRYVDGFRGRRSYQTMRAST